MVISDLDDLSMVKNEDLIRILNRGQAMGDHEASVIFHHRKKGALNFLLGQGIDGTGGFIKDQHRRTTDHGSCDCQ